MASVIEVFGSDGSLQSVSLRQQVRADEVVNAIARRRGVPSDRVSFFTLYQAVAWQEAWAPMGAAFFAADGVKTRIELKKLAPDDRPLKVRAQCEARVQETRRALKEEAESKNLQVSLRSTISFAFLDGPGEQVFRENFEEIMARSSSNTGSPSSKNRNQQQQQQATQAFKSPLKNSASPKSPNDEQRSTAASAKMSVEESQGINDGDGAQVYKFTPINTIGRGDKSGFLFQRSAANPREWQRRWCVLRKTELIHSLNSSGGPVDAQVILLQQNLVKPIPATSLGGLKHCFEIDTPHDVLQFRAKTEEEAKEWVDAITDKINLASENEKFHLAERMVEDGQRASCSRDEALIENALGSLNGLLSSHAGADRLYRFAKRSSLGKKSERNGELVAFYLDLERAHAAFSSMPGTDTSGSASNNTGSSGRDSEVYPSRPGSFKYYTSSLSSIASSSGSSATGATLRGSAAALSRKEWMIQICERFLTAFELSASSPSSSSSPRDQDANSGISSFPGMEDDASKQQLSAILRATDNLRIELVDENLQFIPRESCIIVIEEARQVVRQSIEAGLYQDFLKSKDYERIIASIPSRIRSR